MNVLLIPIGSAGDVHPFVGLGLALQARGHAVTLATNAHFQPLVERAGLAFEPLGTLEEFRDVLENPDLWHPMKGFKLVMQGVMRMTRPLFELVAEHAADGETVVVGASLAFGARVAQEALGFPLVTVHLQPGVFRSVYEGPVLGPFRFDRPGPRVVKRIGYRLIDYLIDGALAGDLNAFRAELGLPPVRRMMQDWWNSPDLVLGLFPEWFAPAQPDWPSQTRLTQFPLYDERGATALPEGMAEFLDRGTPPIVFTPGSAMWHGEDFFRAAVEACARLGRRGLLLTRHPQQIPAVLPDSVRHFDYAPFSELLPRSAALVHHGGIGTSAQGLAAGIPQLVMPMAHDQHDNAARLARHGIARSLAPKRFKGPRVAQALGELLDSPEVAHRCREIAARFTGIDPSEETCRLIEALAPRRVAKGQEPTVETSQR
ncbi:MAG TPA: glycosyltransferase [Isosphaeraceae bacterium]|nr:glycosyltransferase [Isosphaeraceae bacterium]